MNVLQFVPREASRHWQRAEMNTLLAACGDSLDKGAVSGWEIGETESGDPQLYLLGPAPDHECILCVSRLGRLYVLEDGEGRILCEHDAVGQLSKQVSSALGRRKGAIAARALAVWLAIKETFEERIEPALSEPVEVLSHIAPQLVALV
ncbi:MAG: hypothetical protein ACK4UO_09665 [Pseudolabrys sp.]